MGRPTKYKPEFAQQAAKLCLLGATDAQLADFFEVSVSTINLWKTQHPEFSESIKVPKGQADERVEQSLYRRAMGYEHDEVDIRVIEGAVVQTPIRKFYPPDTTAAIFWLKNRKPADWRDKQEVEHQGKVTVMAGPLDERL
jgi:transposase-like protein